MILRFGIALAHFLEQRRAVHLRHHHVGHDEIDRAVLLLERFMASRPLAASSTV